MTKQGRAAHSGREATQPTSISHAVSPGAATQPGTIEFKGSRPMYDEGRGFQSPSPKATEYNKGSQGKH